MGELENGRYNNRQCKEQKGFQPEIICTVCVEVV